MKGFNMTMKEKVDKIYTILSGNGEVGLCEKVRNNGDAIESMKAIPGQIKKWFLFVLGVFSFLSLIFNIAGSEKMTAVFMKLAGL